MTTKGPPAAHCSPILPPAPSMQVECRSTETASQKCTCSNNTNASAKSVLPPPPPTLQFNCPPLLGPQTLTPPPAPGPPCMPPCRPCPCRKQKDCKYNFLKLLQPCKTKPKCKCYSPYAHLPFPICSWFASPKYFHLSSVRQCCKPKCLFTDEWKVGDFGNLSTNETLSEHEIRPSISTNTLHGIRSVNDLRAWSVCGEDQRRYFLEQMLKSRPVEAKEEILDELAREASPMQMRYENLISQKDEEIERLKKKVRELEGKRTEAPAKKASDTPPPRKKSGPTPSASRKNSEPPKKPSDPSRKVSIESPSSPRRKASEPPLSPSGTASELPGSPSGKASELQRSSSGKTSELLRSPSGKASELQRSPSGKTSDLQGPPSEKASELQRSPSGKASELQRSPSGKASQLQRSPSGKASDLERSPSEKASELQRSPSGKASELQRSPSGKASELQRSPSGKASELERSPSGKASELQQSPSEKASELPSSLSRQESESPPSPSRQPSELPPSPSRKASDPIQENESDTSPTGLESDPSAPPPTEESESNFRPSPSRRASESSPTSDEPESSSIPSPSMNELGQVLPETTDSDATSSPSRTESVPVQPGEHESVSSLSRTESGSVAPGGNEEIPPPSRTESVPNPSAAELSDQPAELDAMAAYEEELFEDAEETVAPADIANDEAPPPAPQEQAVDTAQEEPDVTEKEVEASSAEMAQAPAAAEAPPPPSSSKSATAATPGNVPNVANGMPNQKAAYHEATRRQDKKQLVCSSCEPQPPCLPCETTPEAYVCPSIHDVPQYPLENTFGYDTYIEVEGNRIKKMRDGMVIEEMEPETLVAELEWLRESMMANGQRVLDLEEALFHGNDFETEDLYTACQLRSQVRLLRERLCALESQLGDKEAYEKQLHMTLDETAMQLNQYRQEAERCRQCLADAEENVLQLRLRIMDLETGKDDEQCYYDDPCQDQQQQDIDEQLNLHVQMHNQNVECGYYG